MIKAVYFDVGNTICFFNYDFLKDLLVERYAIDVTTEELEATHRIIRKSVGPMLNRGLTHESLVAEAYRSWFRALGVEEDKIEDIIGTIKNHPFSHLFWARTEEGTKELLVWLKEKGYRLGIISNAEGQIKRLISHIGFEPVFDVIIDSHEVGFQKPDQRIFDYALKELDVKASEAVHVGDLIESDIAGARAAGIIPILVDREGQYKDADCIRVARVQELKDLPLFA
jgi:HAD superfamily hydrolase (TIGR01549 family)